MKVKNHLLFDDRDNPINFQKSPNQSAPIYPIYLIMHYTASPNMDGAVSWFMNPSAQASAHLVIGRDGKLVQMVAFNRRAWHAGVSKWGELENLNQFSLGIELVNAGKLRKNPAGKWENWAKIIIPDDQVTIATHKQEQEPTGWHEYTDIQIEVALQAAIALHERYPFSDILGHDDISPGRKADPGPLFPLNSFKSRILGRM